jgi:hypothetical protein
MIDFIQAPAQQRDRHAKSQYLKLYGFLSIIGTRFEFLEIYTKVYCDIY